MYQVPGELPTAWTPVIGMTPMALMAEQPPLIDLSAVTAQI